MFPDSEMQLCDKTKLFLLFLRFLLPTVNAFNVAFQATTHTTIHQLHPEMKRLTTRILRYFVDADAIDDVTKTPFKEPSSQLNDDQLEVGEEARQLDQRQREDGMGAEVDIFFHRVRLFYVTFVKTLMKKFPFGSTVLCDLRILNPSERRTLKDFPAAVLCLAKQFPYSRHYVCSTILLRCIYYADGFALNSLQGGYAHR